MPRSSMALEILTLRPPADDPDFHDMLWLELDEQHFSPELRSRLNANGLRAGVARNVPENFAQLLAASQSTVPAGDGATVVDFDTQPRVVRRLLQTGVGKPAKIVTAGEDARLESIQLLTRDENAGLHGRTFQQAAGLFLLRAYPEADGRVRIELTPEIEYGPPQRHFVGNQGMLRVEFGPECELFDALKLDARLSPGHMLFIGCLAEKPGTLGDHLLVERHADAADEQKLIVIRVAQAPTSAMFDASDVVGPAAESIPDQPPSVEVSDADVAPAE